MPSLADQFPAVTRRNQPLAPHTRLKIGGPAEFLVEPADADELRAVLAARQQALETELAPSRRARLHAATAAALEALRSATVDNHLAELAHHALAGAIAGSAPDAVRWSVRAGERAEVAHAPEDAAGHYERALDVVDLAFPGDLQQRLDLLRALGRAWAAAPGMSRRRLFCPRCCSPRRC